MISYKQLQGSGLVRAAAVGSFTQPNVRQLIIFKEMTLEIWEMEEERPSKVSSTELCLKVCHCVLLQNPWGFSNLSSTSLDRLLVTDDNGNISILEWSMSIMKYAAIKVISAETDKLVPILHHSILSKPSTFRGDTPLSSLVERSREKDVGAKDWFGKIRSITLVAMALYENVIQILVAAWVPVTHYQKTNLQGTVSHRPLLNEYHLNMKEEAGLVSIASQIHKVPIIVDLALIECLDWKAHPLLVVLSAQEGLVYNLVTVQCFSIDLVGRKIEMGPWKISNVHPTSKFVVPWSQEDIISARHTSDVTVIENGLKAGAGVLVISSRGLLFIDLMGSRTSLSFVKHLDGTPTCCEFIKDLSFVLGDSSGALYVLDLKKWDQQIIQKVNNPVPYSPAHILLLWQVRDDEMWNTTNFLFFLSGKTCSPKFITIYPCQGGTYQVPFCGERQDSPAALSSLSSQNVGASTNTEGAVSWYTKEILKQPYLLDDTTCVRDMILIHCQHKSPQQQVLVACGSAPNATIRRGTLGVALQNIKLLDDKGKTEIITVDGEIENEWHIQGLERECCTLAVMVVSGDWLVQVTTCSMRVLSQSEPRTLVAEWVPPIGTPSNIARGFGPERSLCHDIHHASLCVDGAVVATNAMVYSVKLNESGKLQTIGTNIRDHEVSALGVFEFWIAGDSNTKQKRRKLYAKHLTSPRVPFENADLYFIVVVAQWYTNTVHLLTWPDLEEMISIHAGSVPVRCIHVTTLGNEQYLVVGTSDGNVLYFEIKYTIPKRNMETQDGSMNTHTYKSTPNMYPSFYNSEREDRTTLSCLAMMSRLQNPMDHDDSDQSLRKFNLKLLKGKRLILGGSIEYMVSGPICGPEFDFTRNLRLENPDCLFIQGDLSVVLCSKEDGELQAFYVWGSIQPFGASSRVHTKTLPNGLLVLSKDGQIVFGRLDMSLKLHWEETRVLGTPQHLAYHHESGCVAITSNDGGSVCLSLVHVQSMCQVLTMELGSGQHLTALKVLNLPCVKPKGAEAWKECIIVASQRSKKEHAQGIIHFFEFNHQYPCDQEVQYELSLLGMHYTELSCHAICLLDSQRKALPSGVCDICSISSYVEDFEPLNSALKHLSHGSSHWNDYCREQEGERGLDYQSRSLLVLGYNGRVEVVTIVIGNNLTSILLAPSLAHAIKVVVPSLPEGSEPTSPYVSDNESDHEDVSISNKCNTTEIHTQPPKVPKSLICITKLTGFDSPGGGCVTTILAIVGHNFLVVEMLRGVGAFSLQDNGQVIQLAWHPFSTPLLAVIPLNPDLYIALAYEKGIQLMERNYVAEQAFQDEEKRRHEEDVERGLGLGLGPSAPSRSENEVRRHEMPGFNVERRLGLELGPSAQNQSANDVKRHEMPGFNVLASHPTPATGLYPQRSLPLQIVPLLCYFQKQTHRECC